MADLNVTVRTQGVVAAVLDKLRRAFGMTVLADGETGEGTSDVELRRALHDGLRALEPGYFDIAEVFPDTSTVIYMAMPEDALLYLRRTFTRGEDGTAVTLNDDRVEVAPQTRWEPVTAAAADDAPAADTVAATPASTPAVAANSGAGSCSCNQGNGQAAQPTAHDALTASTAALRGADMTAQVTELVGRLIACKGSPFDETARATLAALTEPQLTTMLTVLEAANGTPAAPTVPATDDEWLRAAPATIRELVAHYQARDTAERTSLVTALARAQDVLPEAVLVTRSTTELRQLATMLKINAPPRDYTGARIVPLASDAPTVRELPDTYGMRKAVGGGA